MASESAILDVKEIKTVPYVPLSHPFVERLIGTIRRECLDRTLFWTVADLEMKLLDFQQYETVIWRTRRLADAPPEPSTDVSSARASVGQYRWRRHCSWAASDADRGVTLARRGFRGALGPRKMRKGKRPLCTSSLSEGWRGFVFGLSHRNVHSFKRLCNTIGNLPPTRSGGPL